MLAIVTKHQREAALFREFTQRYAVPAGRVDHLDEPDFRIHTATQGVLGVEVTELFQQSGRTGSQGQEVERTKLLEAVKQRCIEADVPPAHVAVFFAPYVRLDKVNRTDCASRIAKLIQTRMPPTDDGYTRVQNSFSDDAIPDCVLSITIARFPWLERHHLSAPDAGWVQTDCIALIQTCLDAKAKLYEKYRAACTECWLLIGSSGFQPSSLFAASPETYQHEYETPFQKVFWLEGFSHSLMELRTVLLR